MQQPSRAVVLSGCSGGGKSTVLEDLASRGFTTIDEPGRRIVRDELATDGRALPWVDATGFAHRCIDTARADLAHHDRDQWVFFDRGLVDADTALRHYGGGHHSGHDEGSSACSIEELQSYHKRVFFTPPWPELYANDEERQLNFADAVDEYSRLLDAYERLGYSITVLPKVGVTGRSDLILAELHLL